MPLPGFPYMHNTILTVPCPPPSAYGAYAEITRIYAKGPLNDFGDNFENMTNAFITFIYIYSFTELQYAIQQFFLPLWLDFSLYIFL